MKSTRTVTFTFIWTAVPACCTTIACAYTHTHTNKYMDIHILCPYPPHHSQKEVHKEKLIKLISSGESTWHGLGRKNQTSQKNTHFLTRLITIYLR